MKPIRFLPYTPERPEHVGQVLVAAPRACNLPHVEVLHLPAVDREGRAAVLVVRDPRSLGRPSFASTLADLLDGAIPRTLRAFRAQVPMTSKQLLSSPNLKGVLPLDELLPPPYRGWGLRKKEINRGR